MLDIVAKALAILMERAVSPECPPHQAVRPCCVKPCLTVSAHAQATLQYQDQTRYSRQPARTTELRLELPTENRSVFTLRLDDCKLNCNFNATFAAQLSCMQLTLYGQAQQCCMSLISLSSVVHLPINIALQSLFCSVSSKPKICCKVCMQLAYGHPVTAEQCTSACWQVVQVDPPGRRKVLSWGRKMLGDLELSGDGVSAQTTDVGVSGKAFGQGELNGLDDSHIQVGIRLITHVCIQY